VFAPLPKIGSLRLIIDGAEWLGLSSEQAEQISISNGSEILNLARIAIRRQDREALEQLFEQAARLTCTDLWIELFGLRCSAWILRLASPQAFNYLSGRLMR